MLCSLIYLHFFNLGLDKVINYQYAEAYIIGSKKDELGLLLGLEENNKIRPAGILEFMNPEAKKLFYKNHKELITGEDKKFIFLDPKMKCTIKFRIRKK